MFLKSFKIKNFRKFGDNEKSNKIEFAESGDYLSTNSNHEDKEINIASKTTLIVGKNNTGKTTIIDAMDIILNKNGKFSANDFNFKFLKKVLRENLKNLEDVSNVPYLEFEFCINIDDVNSTDVLSKMYQVLSIGDLETKECVIKLKYEPTDSTQYLNSVKGLSLINNQSLQMEKYLHLIDETKFKLSYYNSDDIQIKDFKLSDLIELTYIRANNIREEKCLTNAFTKIVEYKYNNIKKENLDIDNSLQIDDNIDDINKEITGYMEKHHTQSLNKTLTNIVDSEKCLLSLKSVLTVKDIMTNVIKCYFKDNDEDIPENQFGLGYTNLIMIVAEILQYMEKYPVSSFNSQVNLIAIEEPETFMHPQMQELFIKRINDTITELLDSNKKNINSQLIITTHSPHILNSKIHTGGTFNNITYIKEKNGISQIISLSDKAIAKYTAKEEAKLAQGKKDFQHYFDFEFIKKHIKFKVSEIFFADAIIFVEGVTEYNLLPLYIDKDEFLSKKYISIVLINGAHAKMYNNLIELIGIPTLFITDLDIKRANNEKGIKKKGKIEKDQDPVIFLQLTDLTDRITTNSTLIEYLKGENLKNIDQKDYPKFGTLTVVFQKDKIEGQYASSFEEAFLLTNCNNKNLQALLQKIKPDVTKRIGKAKQIIDNSFEWQHSLNSEKSNFANSILYDEIMNESDSTLYELPKYIVDGLDSIKKQLGE